MNKILYCASSMGFFCCKMTNYSNKNKKTYYYYNIKIRLLNFVAG